MICHKDKSISVNNICTGDSAINILLITILKSAISKFLQQKIIFDKKMHLLFDKDNSDTYTGVLVLISNFFIQECLVH